MNPACVQRDTPIISDDEYVLRKTNNMQQQLITG